LGDKDFEKKNKKKQKIFLVLCQKRLLPSLTCTKQTNAQVAILHSDDLPLCVTHNTTDVHHLKNDTSSKNSFYHHDCYSQHKQKYLLKFIGTLHAYNHNETYTPMCRNYSGMSNTKR
jgi:hypothetical protein